MSLKQELNLFYLALSFFTRIPVPKTLDYSDELLNRASRYFSLVGAVLAVLLTLVYLVATQFFSPAVAVLLVMLASLLLTGAFHEDGLADMADGIGGGYTIEKRLEIMKDSRVGTYGVVTLVAVFALKFTLLLEIAEAGIQAGQEIGTMFMVLVTGNALSRAVAGSLIYDMPYVTDIDASKSKPLAEQQSSQDLSLLLLIGLLPLMWFSVETLIICCLVLVLFRWGFKAWLMARLGGFTGDCLGAGQQIAELLIYLLLLANIFSSSGVSP